MAGHNPERQVRSFAVFGGFVIGVAIFVGVYNNAACGGDGKTRYKSSLDEYLTDQMEDPKRGEWQKPGKVADYLVIRNGDTVADLGAGTGYFTVIFSKRVGENGKVYAVDVEESMLSFIKKKAAKAGLSNINYVLSPPDDPLLPKASADLIFIGNSYFYLEKKDRYLRLLRDALKDSGRLAILDFHYDMDLTGKISAPPVNFRVPKDRVLEDFVRAGFKLEAEYFFLSYQYFFVFTK